MKNRLNSSPRIGARAEKLERSAFITLLSVLLLIALVVASNLLAPRTAGAGPAPLTLPFVYTFNNAGTLTETPSLAESSSPYLWLKSGALLPISGTTGTSLQGSLPTTSTWRTIYAKRDSGASDNGAHPQNLFRLMTKGTVANPAAQVYVNRVRDNLANTANRHGYNAESLITRYQDENNFYFASIRADGYAVIKKKTGGVYQTLVAKKIFSGTWSATTNPDLIPLNNWIGMKFSVVPNASGNPVLSLYTDVGKTGLWTPALSVTDDPLKFGSPITAPGLVGIQSDYADIALDDFRITNADASLVSAPVPTPTPAPSPAPAPTPTTGYDSTVLSDTPVMYLTMASPSSGSETDKSGHGIIGTYKGGAPGAAKLPNGDSAADFNGSSQYLTVPSSSALSIPTTGKLTWEAWIRPDTFQFASASGDGYVDWMGKCENYSPTCEWEARIYGDSTPEGRPDRLSAYVFNPSAGLGSSADWQPASNLQSGQWIHVVAEYDTTATPSGCNSAYPGSINIWVNGVKQDAAAHFPTGCMSQYSIKPRAGSSSFTIGTMAFDTWFNGAVGKVAVYNYLLSQTQINGHYQAMKGIAPSGSCGQTCTIP